MRKCCNSQRNLGSICGSLFLSLTHLSHKTHINPFSTLSRIKCERYIFLKKCVRSFIIVDYVSACICIRIVVSCLYNNYIFELSFFFISGQTCSNRPISEQTHSWNSWIIIFIVNIFNPFFRLLNTWCVHHIINIREKSVQAFNSWCFYILLVSKTNSVCQRSLWVISQGWRGHKFCMSKHKKRIVEIWEIRNRKVYWWINFPEKRKKDKRVSYLIWNFHEFPDIAEIRPNRCELCPVYEHLYIRCKIFPLSMILIRWFNLPQILVRNVHQCLNSSACSNVNNTLDR